MIKPIQTVAGIRTLRQAAELIRRRWPGLRVTLDEGFYSTDRKIAGTRLRHPGKGRRGLRLRVERRTKTNCLGWELIFELNMANPYARVEAVRAWLARGDPYRRCPSCSKTP